MDSPVSARCAVLQALRLRGASYAAALIEQVYEATSHRILLRDGSVYPLLKKLEAEGLVEAVPPSEARDGVLGSQGRFLGRPVRMFSLTVHGRHVAETEARAILCLLGLSESEVQLTSVPSPMLAKAGE